MYASACVAVLACILSLLLTPLVRSLALRWGVTDHPDFRRKIHTAPIARAGGVVMVLSYVLAFAVLLILPFEAAAFVRDNLHIVLQVLPAA